jgi:hypothetical protein
VGEDLAVGRVLDPHPVLFLDHVALRRQVRGRRRAGWPSARLRGTACGPGRCWARSRSTRCSRS